MRALVATLRDIAEEIERRNFASAEAKLRALEHHIGGVEPYKPTVADTAAPDERARTMTVFVDGAPVVIPHPDDTVCEVVGPLRQVVVRRKDHLRGGS